MIVYIYDLKSINKKTYNNLKRNFYYSIKKLKNKYKQRTKSVIVINNNDEKEFDIFFSQWEGQIDLYKIKTETIEKILSSDKL